MTAVLLSVRPRRCELIASGQKTIEVRKSAPKLETPVKVYIYETQGRYADARDCRTYRYWDIRQTVIGEFICDCITPLYNVCTDDWNRLLGGMHEIEKRLVKNACMTEANHFTSRMRELCGKVYRVESVTERDNCVDYSIDGYELDISDDMIECVIPADEVVKPFDVQPIKAGFCFCGVRVNENQSFCPHCGIRLDWGE